MTTIIITEVAQGYTVKFEDPRYDTTTGHVWTTDEASALISRWVEAKA